jgi:hypothetical protein
MTSATLPLLFKVNVWALLVELRFWLVKVKLETVVPPIGEVPLPVNVITCGLPLALSEMLMEAVRLKIPPGVKVTLKAQVPLGAIAVVQVLVSAKSLALVPITEMLVKVRLELPVFVSVTPWGELVTPCGWDAKLMLDGFRLTVAPDPVPLRVTDCWLPATLFVLSVTFSVAERLPGAAGVKVTLMVQLPFAATEPPQVLVCAKSPGLVPVKPIPLMVKATLPVLLREKVWAVLVVPTFWVPKVSVVAVRFALGALPVPLTVTVCCVPAALLLLSVIVKFAVREPEAVGENVTLMTQLAFEATELPHVLVCAKSPEFVPVNPMLLTVKAALPVLVKVTVWTLLVEPTFCPANVRLEGLTPAVGAVPIPVSPTVCGLLTSESDTLTEALRVKAAVGVNITDIVQVPLTAKDPPQVVVSEKSPALVPVTPTLLMVKLAAPVFLTVMLVGELEVPTVCPAKLRLAGENVICPEMPVPLRATVCGLVAALSVTVKVADSDDVVDGVNVMPSVQLLPAVKEAPQVLLLTAKSPEFAPPKVTLVKVRVALPEFVMSTDCALLVVPWTWLPKLRLEGDRLAVGPTPVPVRVAVWVVPVTLLLLSVTVSTPLRVPDADGVKVMVMVQLLVAATEPPQLFDCAKSPEFAPDTAILPMVRLAFPVLFRVIVWPALVEPTFWLVNVKLVVVRPATGALPVPESEMLWGLPVALSVMLTDAVRGPEAVGVKVTLMEQLPPAATGLPQVLLCAKSPELVPVTTTVLIFRVAFPVLLTVTVWAELVEPTPCEANVRLEAERLTTEPNPTPVKGTICGLVEALSTIMTEADRFPTALGVNVTVIVQSTPAARVAGQVLVEVKSPALVPVTLMLEIDRFVFPLFVNVVDWEGLVVPTDWLAKVRLAGDRLTAGPEPVPARLVLWTVPVTSLLLSVTANVAVRGPGAVGVNVTLMVQLLVAARADPQLLVWA